MNDKKIHLKHDEFSRGMLRDEELLTAFIEMRISKKLFSMLYLDTIE